MTIKARYEIGCKCCGVIDYSMRKEDAFNLAECTAVSHGCSGVYVYDRMSHIDKPNLWLVDEFGVQEVTEL